MEDSQKNQYDSPKNQRKRLEKQAGQEGRRRHTLASKKSTSPSCGARDDMGFLIPINLKEVLGDVSRIILGHPQGLREQLVQMVLTATVM